MDHNSYYTILRFSTYLTILEISHNQLLQRRKRWTVFASYVLACLLISKDCLFQFSILAETHKGFLILVNGIRLYRLVVLLDIREL